LTPTAAHSRGVRCRQCPRNVRAHQYRGPNTPRTAPHYAHAREKGTLLSAPSECFCWTGWSSQTVSQQRPLLSPTSECSTAGPRRPRPENPPHRPAHYARGERCNTDDPPSGEVAAAPGDCCTPAQQLGPARGCCISRAAIPVGGSYKRILHTPWDIDRRRGAESDRSLAGAQGMLGCCRGCQQHPLWGGVTVGAVSNLPYRTGLLSGRPVTSPTGRRVDSNPPYRTGLLSGPDGSPRRVCAPTPLINPPLTATPPCRGSF